MGNENATHGMRLVTVTPARTPLHGSQLSVYANILSWYRV